MGNKHSKQGGGGGAGAGCWHLRLLLLEFGKCGQQNMPPPAPSGGGGVTIINNYPPVSVSPGFPASAPAVPVPSPAPKSSKTMVRLTIGSHETKQMGGGVPSVAIFSEFGQRIGQTESKVMVPAGAYKDIMVTHKKEHENVRPSYLLLNGGQEAICISSIGLEYPDGSKNFLTGNDLDRCHRLATDHSRTWVGSSAAQPNCFWLHGSNTPGEGIRRVSLHLPDFVWTQRRREAYLENKDLACHRSPRFFTIRGHGEEPPLSWSIPIFNPPLEYDPKTNFDRYPQRVLQWQFPGPHRPDLKHEFSDVPWKALAPYHPGVRRRSEVLDTAENTKANVEKDALSRLAENVVSFGWGKVEEEKVRTAAPRLIISNGSISAEEQCLAGEWDHTDYVSLAEQLYCDMQSRSLFPFCDNDQGTTHHCWNSVTETLQGFETSGLTQHINLASKFGWNGTAAAVGSSELNGTASLWAATGPLFQYSYHNVSFIG